MRTMKRLAAIGCGTALAFGAVTGCGSDDSGGDSENAGGSTGGDYCGLVEEAQGKFGDFSQDASIDDFKDLEAQVGEVTAAAPDDIKSDWENLGSVVSELITTLEDTGIPTDEPLGEAAAEIPPKKQQELMKPLLQDMQAMKDSQEKVRDHVEKECDITLGSESGGSQ